MAARGLVVADDFTGAADTGAQFAKRGYATSIAADGDPGTDVIVVDTNTRKAPPDRAYDAVVAAIDGHPASAVYKKVDSTLRGNVAAEVEAALDATGAALAVVAPAFPAAGRTTAGGVHLVDGTPVTGTGFGADDENPPATSSLPDLLAAGEHPVERLPVEVVAAGAAAVRSALSSVEGRPAVVACDATHGAHLRAIADGAGRVGADVVYAGSAGLAGHLRFPGGPGGALGVVGSTCRETFAGIDALPEATVVELDGELAATDPDRAADDAAGRATETLRARGRAVIVGARSPGDVRATLDAGASAGFEDRETRERVASALAGAAAGVAGEVPVRGLLASGGAIAATTIDRLGADGIDLSGHEVAEGVPVGRVRGGAADGTPIVTKAGGFGGTETLTACLDYLERAA